jgi:hypothetical protein
MRSVRQSAPMSLWLCISHWNESSNVSGQAAARNMAPGVPTRAYLTPGNGAGEGCVVAFMPTA